MVSLIGFWLDFGFNFTQLSIDLVLVSCAVSMFVKISLHHSARMPHWFGVLLQVSPKWNDTGVEQIIQFQLYFSARWRACPYFKAHPSVLWGKFASDCRVTQAQWMAYPQPWSQPPRLWYLVHTWEACLRCENPWCWALVWSTRERMGWHQIGGSTQGHWLIYQACGSLHRS